jgi:hypothetical protein
MTNSNHEQEAAYWRSEADRQLERADVLERALERNRGLLDAFLDYFKSQITEATTDGAAQGEGRR